MRLGTNIARRKGSANWYFRRAWPKELRPAVGRAEHWESLRTPDLKEARSRAVEANWRFEQRLNALRRRCAPTVEQMEVSARDLYKRELLIDEHERLVADDPVDYGQMFRPGFEGWLRESLARGLADPVRWAVDEIIEKNDWLIERNSAAYNKLGCLVARAQVEAVARFNERDRGDFTGVPRDPLLTKAVTAVPQHAKRGESVMELFERYARDQRRQNADTLDQSRKIIRRFAEFVGSESPASAVSRANAREWKFALQSWPVKANEIREFRGLDFRAIIEANRFLKKPSITEPTIAKYLSTLGSFGQWLIRHGSIDKHPVQGLLPERGRRQQKRRPFTTDEL